MDLFRGRASIPRSVSFPGHGTRKHVLVLCMALVVALMVVAAISEMAAAKVPRGFIQGKVVGGISEPTSMAFAPDGRIFVAQQGGKLRVVKDGRLLSQPFAAVSADSRGERGLLGVALDPDFASNGHVYVYYTARTPRVHNRVARFTANGDVAAGGSMRTILELNNLSERQNHNGGAIHFGRDGKLYIAVGDNANEKNAQSLRNLKGKMLRINKDGSIPRDNPFVRRTAGRNEAIWALGLRNPFSFAVHPGTGKMYINDVGQKTWEEINRGVKGANYGWPRYEGPERDRRYRAPIFAYRHGSSRTTGCAITGGAFYNPANMQFPAAYEGDYFFADFCGGWIRRLDSTTGRVSSFATTPKFGTVDIQVWENGGLYYLSRNTNSVNVIRYVGRG